MNEPVTSVATDTMLDVSVTGAYDGSGAAVNHSTASVSATIKNLSQADDVWYQIDSGSFVQLPERQSVDITINFASQTLKLKRGEFTSSSIPVQVIAYGVPSGTYARGQSVGGSVSLESLAALGVYPGAARRVGPFKIGCFDGQDYASGVDATGGTFTATLNGETTPELAFDCTAEQFKSALEALPSVGSGNVFSLSGTGPSATIVFRNAVAGALLTGDGAGLTGPSAPYTIGWVGLGSWAVDLLTPSVGDTILDLQHAVVETFDSIDPATLAYSDDPDNPRAISGGRWSTADGTDRLIKLDDGDSFTNFRGTTAGDLGYQRSVRAMQLAYSTPGESVVTTVPVVVKNAVPIYAAVDAVGSEPSTGEVWIWVDIVPATAPEDYA